MKKFLSLILVLAMLLSLGVTAFAADKTAADTVLTVSTQTGKAGAKTVVKSYTKAELAKLAQTNADGSAYEYYKEGWQAVVATQYVTLDALLADAGVTFTADNSLSFTCADGAYTKAYPTYKDLSEGKYYFDGTSSTEVPAALALVWGSGSLKDGTVADIAKTAKDSGSLRFVCGTTEADYKATKSAGKRMPSGVTDISVVSPVSFTDVTSADWFHDDVLSCAEAGYMQGAGDKFSPKGTTTRAMVATILYRMAGSPAVTGTSGFTDVAAGKWYANAVTWAKTSGVATGSGDKFNPDGSVTREQLAAFLYRYAQAMKYDTTQGGMSLKEYPDYEATSEYARAALQWCVTMGILNGQNGSIAPQASAQRCELAAMLTRFLAKAAK